MNLLVKYRNNKRLSVIAGVLLAITIVTTQSVIYNFQQVECFSAHIDTDAEKDTNDHAPQYISQDAISVSSVQLNIDKPFQIVCELLLSEDNGTVASPASVPLNFQYFQNLFRTLISPNAP